MNTTSVFVTVLVVWLVSAAVSGIAMARRGHSLAAWTLMGAILGPLVVPLAVEAVGDERRGPGVVLAEGGTGPGALSVLVGVDGSGESEAALDYALATLGERIGQLTVAGVVDYEAATTPRGVDERHRLESSLAAAAVRIDTSLGLLPARVMLEGQPAKELGAMARAEGHDLVVIGARGRGLARAVLGSTASQLIDESGVPVLVVPRDR